MIRPLLIVAIFLPACAAPAGPGMAAGPGTAAMGAPAGVIEAARADAAKRSGLPPAQLQLLAAESVTWPDGSLGCPQKGMLYTQALVPGYRVKLRVGKEVWDYHAGERGAVMLCPPGQSHEPAPGGRN
jgi:hypothetical protein